MMMVSSFWALLGFSLGIWVRVQLAMLSPSLPVLPLGMIVCVRGCVCTPVNGLVICPGCISASQLVAAGIDSSSFSDFN